MNAGELARQDLIPLGSRIGSSPGSTITTRHSIARQTVHCTSCRDIGCKTGRYGGGVPAGKTSGRDRACHPQRVTRVSNHDLRPGEQLHRLCAYRRRNQKRGYEVVASRVTPQASLILVTEAAALWKPRSLRGIEWAAVGLISGAGGDHWIGQASIRQSAHHLVAIFRKI